MTKHATRYHDEDNTASVPNSLTRKPRVLHTDRSLFTISGGKKTRRIEDMSSRDDSKVATEGVSHNNQTMIVPSISPYAASEEGRREDTARDTEYHNDRCFS